MNDGLRIGTAGWHYPAGRGSWNGIFYPKPRPKGFDELSFYAQYFDVVEINTTFYGQPRPEVSAQWVARTPPRFTFCTKLYQQFTHPKLFRERVTRDLAKQLGTTDLPDTAIDALLHANQADLDEFRRGIEPLAAAGKLGPLLAQFPASFHDTADARLHIAALCRGFHGYAVALELRHRSWTDRLAETRALLNAFGASWVWIDEPKFRDSIRQPAITDIAGPLAYVRLHGRNTAEWWRPTHRDDRYAYVYSREELQPIADELEKVVKANLRGYAVLNNHPRAGAVANAADLKALTHQPAGPGYPEALVAVYPRLSEQPVPNPSSLARR
jgi:uncharacterized protein YecE (DUF72 family)